MDEIALLDVLSAARMGPAQAATVEDQREAALDLLGAQRQSLLADPRAQARAIAVNRAPGLEIATPALDRLGLRLGDPGLPATTAGAILQDGAAVVALVGDQLGRALDRRAAAGRVQTSAGGFQGVAERAGITLVRGRISAATIAPVSRSTACSGL